MAEEIARERLAAMTDGYPKQIRISEYDPRKREFVDKLHKVYSAGDEAMVRTWHDDMNRKLQSQQRRDDCAKQEQVR